MTQHQHVRHHANVLSHTDFVDDIVLLSNTINEAQGLLYRVESACNSGVIYLNSPKNQVCCSSIDIPLIEAISDQRQSDGGEPNLNA